MANIGWFSALVFGALSHMITAAAPAACAFRAFSTNVQSPRSATTIVSAASAAFSKSA